MMAWDLLVRIPSIYTADILTPPKLDTRQFQEVCELLSRNAIPARRLDLSGRKE